jgi:hypothetical protein
MAVSKILEIIAFARKNNKKALSEYESKQVISILHRCRMAMNRPGG